jgi:tubulin polyglutamylase TTLL6/13
MISVQPSLKHYLTMPNKAQYSNNNEVETDINSMCFEILGFDVLIDEKLKPLLIEINHAPSFATDTPLDFKMKKDLIADSI